MTKIVNFWSSNGTKHIGLTLFLKIFRPSRKFFSGGVQNWQKQCFLSVNTSVHRVCPEGPNLDPPDPKMTTIWTLFLTLRRTRKRRENINFNSKKDPLFQKFAKICKFWQNFWQFLTIFCKFFFKKNKKLKKIYYKLFFFRHNLRENKSEICQNFLLTHRYVHDKNLSKKLSKICQICTFLSHYVYTFVYTWKTLFFCLNFGPFWTFLSHCVQGVYGHFFHKNFYHFFIFYFFTKFYFSLISRWKFEKTSICTTIW